MLAIHFYYILRAYFSEEKKSKMSDLKYIQDLVIEQINEVSLRYDQMIFISICSRAFLVEPELICGHMKLARWWSWH